MGLSELVLGLSRDAAFLDAAEHLSPKGVAKRYQPRGGYRQSVIEAICERIMGGEPDRATMRVRLGGLTAVACVSDAPPAKSDRK